MGLFDFLNKTESGLSRDRGGTLSVEDPSRPSSKAIIYQSELDYISRCILDYPNIETGGQLFGFWTSTGVPIVCYVIGPGRRAQHNQTSFVQEQDYLQRIGKELYTRYRLQHVGEWHSHHQLGLAHPSGGDVNTMQYGVGKPGFPRLLLCIGNCTRTHTIVNAFNFHENQPRDYVHAAWDIVNSPSPYRAIVDADLQGLLLHPSSKRPAHGQLYTVGDIASGSHSVGTHWLTESAEHVDIMKSFVSMVQSMFPNDVVKPEILPSGEPLIAVKPRNLCIALPYGFPRKGPALLKENGEAYYVNSDDETWSLGEGSLTESFGQWLAEMYKVLNPLANRPIQSGCESSHLDVSEIDADEYRKAEVRTKRIGQENQILEKNLPNDAFTWSAITDNPVVSILAFPVLDKGRYILRFVMPSEFPSAPPEVQFGFSGELPSGEARLPIHMDNVQYKNISELFENSVDVFYDTLKWESDSSIFRAYTIACVLLYYHNIADLEGRNIMDYIQPLLDSPNVLKQMENTIIQAIKETK